MNKSDSPWALVAGVVKGFNIGFDFALYEMSYANIILYTASLPSYRSPKDKDKKPQERLSADDPASMRKFFNKYKD